MELFKASQQWSTRPDDERFWTLDEMRNVCKTYADSAKTSSVPYDKLRAEVDEGEVKIAGRSGVFARLTHWAFGQMARIAEAPAEYLRRLPATLAVQNLNHGLKAHTQTNQASLLFHSNGDLILRSVTSDMYSRIWNWELIDRLLPLMAQGWRVPPARACRPSQAGARQATEADVIDSTYAKESGLSIRIGDMIAPAGLYASDHDMFVFMVNEDKRIEDGSDGGLGRGFFVENSEVRASALKITQFLYRFVCGNHIVWGASKVREISIRHVGSADYKAWRHLQMEVKRYSDSSASDLEAKITVARRYEIAKTKDEVLDRLFGLRCISRKNLELAYELTEKNEKQDGNPRTAWGMAQGITRLSQESSYMDERTQLDKAATRVIEIAF